MDRAWLELFTNKLKVWSTTLAEGLSDEEVLQVEDRYGFTFPPDLRQFLQFALPISGTWINWRDASEAEIRSALAWPAEGICFDVEHNGFWLEAWGPKPSNLAAAFEVVREQVEQAPTLIPILSHRYLPDEPPLAGNPVFSVYQTDIIHYGCDLASYFAHEFMADAGKLPEYHVPTPGWARRSPRPIRFWDEFVWVARPSDGRAVPVSQLSPEERDGLKWM